MGYWRSVALAVAVLLAEAASGPLLQWASDGADRLPDRVLLVTAHPDDEAMFFVPALANLDKQHKQVDLLCMSSGNADGLGSTRKGELRAAAQRLGIQGVTIVEDRHLLDGMDVEWAPSAVAAQLATHVNCSSSSAVLTFDLAGASAHPNHIATARGVMEWAKLRQSGGCGPVQVWQLRSVPAWRRFLGAASAFAEALLMPRHDDDELLLSADPQHAVDAMAAHQSQLVWYRQLFLRMATYARVNRLWRTWPPAAPP